MHEHIIFKFIFLENKETYGKIVFHIFHLSRNVLLYISISVHHLFSFSPKLTKLKCTCRIVNVDSLENESSGERNLYVIAPRLPSHPVYFHICILDTFYILLYNDQLIYKIIIKYYIIIFILHVIRVLWVFVPPNLS